jgi:hypothetical protein
MERSVSLLLLGASLLKVVVGGPVADPVITPAPRVVFRDQSTDPLHFIGWVDSLDGTTTTCEAITQSMRLFFRCTDGYCLKGNHGPAPIH